MSWETNAIIVQEVYGCYVNWLAEFYFCPDCGEPVYKCDWETDSDVKNGILCPICGFNEEDE